MKRIPLANRRKAVGLSQERLAETLGVDPSTVRRWESGDTEPQPWHRPNLAKALSISLSELDQLLRGLPPNAVLGVGSTPLGDSADDLITVQSFRLADRQVGGGQLYATVTGYLQHTIAPRLFGTSDPDGGNSIFAAAAGLTEMAGWMAHDTGRDDLAEQHFNRALGLSTVGGDDQLGAHVCASLSHLSHHRRRPDQAVAFAQQGRLRLGSAQLHPGVQARLLAMEARGHASLGQSAECADRLRLADQALDVVPNAELSPWASAFDQASLATEAARCFRELRQLETAKRYAEEVVSLRPADRPRSRAFAQLLLVSVLIDQGRIDEACVVAREIMIATRSLSSYLVVQQLDQLGRRLAPHRRASEVAVFLGLLREELTTRRSMRWFAAQGTRTNG